VYLPFVFGTHLFKDISYSYLVTATFKLLALKLLPTKFKLLLEKLFVVVLSVFVFKLLNKLLVVILFCSSVLALKLKILLIILFNQLLILVSTFTGDSFSKVAVHLAVP